MTIIRYLPPAHSRIWNLLLVFLCVLKPTSQGIAGLQNTPEKSLLRIHVPFLEHAPVIDGILDDNLTFLPIQEFSHMEGFNPGTKHHDFPTYRLAYGTEFLYLHLSFESDRIVSRDRAYQNGDGFHIALTVPRQSDAPSNEFYVLGFSPDPPVNQSWQKKFVWYYNVDLKMTPLGQTQFAWQSSEGKVGLEMLLPWSEVYPCHPWLSEGIGFNLCFVKAVGEKDKDLYFVTLDRFFQSEQQMRKYVHLQFGDPKVSGRDQAYMVLDRNHLSCGEHLSSRVALVSSQPGVRPVGLRMWSGEGTSLWTKTLEIAYEAGVKIVSTELPMSELPSGGYQVSWTPQQFQPGARIGLTILPPETPDSLRMLLRSLDGRINPGSLTTLEFHINDLERRLRRLKSYESAGPLHILANQIFNQIRQALSGRDVVATRVGIQRRAYRSKVDNTLQPYSIKVPAAMQPVRRYPLLVFLHGSGEDDRNQLARTLTKGDFLELAPMGRGTSNYYTTDHSQYDIREAIDDVIANYPVDTTRIILAGFSMGGYGVYRTFYENPARFRALAVFAGHPNLANRSLGGNHSNFLEDNNLLSFKKIPIFIFHGSEDRNLPVSETYELVEKLRRREARVLLHVESGKGHEFPSKAIMEQFYAWLQEVLDDQ